MFDIKGVKQLDVVSTAVKPSPEDGLRVITEVIYQMVELCAFKGVKFSWNHNLESYVLTIVVMAIAQDFNCFCQKNRRIPRVECDR
jgi:hypothetical protein